MSKFILDNDSQISSKFSTGDLIKTKVNGSNTWRRSHFRPPASDLIYGTDDSESQPVIDNTPAIIYTDIVPGDKVKITVVPKGGGAENMSRLGMLTPAAGRKGVVDLVLDAVDKAGSNPCPPIIVGVGIGGTAEKTLQLAKKSLLRKVGEHNPDPEVAELEKELLEKVNNLGIGPMGYGGRTTALAVNVEVFPAHIASMPVAVNLNCHSSRHKEAVL